MSDSSKNNILSNAFKKLFTSYTHSFNKMYNRKGALFQPRFRRRIIEDKNHLINSIIYIHNNPVTHGFVNCNTEWVYTSFLNIIEKNKLSWFNANEVITLFDDIHNFKSCHVMKCELDEIEDFIQF